MDSFSYKMKESKSSSSPIDRHRHSQIPASNPLTVDTSSSVLRYSRSAAMAIARGCLSATNPGGKLHQLILQNQADLGSNSRGSSSSLSPLSAIENLESPLKRSSSQLFPSSLKVKEDVLVMDGILLGSSPRGRARAILDSCPSPMGTNSSSHFKTEICSTWENSGSCHCGSKCQVFKAQVTPGSSSKRIYHVTASTETAKPGNMQEEGQWVVVSRPAALPDNWSPADDGIKILHPASQGPPSREAVDGFIDKALSGAVSVTQRPRGKKAFDNNGMQESKASDCSRNMCYLIQKVEKKWWSRLWKQGRKPVFLSVDWDKWVDEDDEQEDKYEIDTEEEKAEAVGTTS
ncbi:hypothetical protein Sjap_018639 [Stephania japonica]|uniref:Co-chaperone protein p23 n=1 Tax=Stephania japonica TaxID=461633 RepID=A0AAP0I8E0_9MAGN